jgi:hypothetical protein
MRLTGLLGSVDSRLGLIVLGYVPAPLEEPAPTPPTRVWSRPERRRRKEDPYAILLLVDLITEDY